MFNGYESILIFTY